MKKTTKRIILVLAAALLGAVLIYQYGTLSLGSRIPDKDWVSMKLQYLESEDSREAPVYEIRPMEQTLARIRAQRVLRDRNANPGQEQTCRVTLEASDGTATVVVAGKDGRIWLCREEALGQWESFRAGSALHIYLARVRMILSGAWD